MSVDIKMAGLSVIGSRYQPRTTIYTATVNGIQKILSADARRFTVRFLSGGIASAISTIVPGPPPIGLITSSAVAAVLDYDYSNWPGIVGGEFYSNLNIGNSILIVECLYLG